MNGLTHLLRLSHGRIHWYRVLIVGALCMWSDRCAYGFHAFACLAWAMPCPCMSCWAMPWHPVPCLVPCPWALAHVPCMRAMVPCMRAMVPCSTHEQRPWCLPAHGASAHEQRPWCQRSAHEQRPWCQRPWCLPASSAHEQRPWCLPASCAHGASCEQRP